MHDPETVAFEIKYPWRAYRNDAPSDFLRTYRNPFITIWHHDPEADGSDDSCGWSAPKLSKNDLALAKELADWEEKRPYYFAQPVIHEERSYDAEPWGGAPGTTTEYQCYRISPGDCAALVVDLLHMIRWRLDKKWGLTPRLLSEAMILGTREVDNFQSSFAFWEDEMLQPTRRRDKIERTFAQIIRCYRRLTRPWYRHPRWHIRHWSFQVHPLQDFKRWAFTRCTLCGGRFAWGESGVGTWDGGGPQWFGGERLTHMNCSGYVAAKQSQPVGIGS